MSFNHQRDMCNNTKNDNNNNSIKRYLVYSEEGVIEAFLEGTLEWDFEDKQRRLGTSKTSSCQVESHRTVKPACYFRKVS